MTENVGRRGVPSNLGELRVRIDQYNERIVSKLKDRVRFPQNEAVYEPNGVPIDEREDVSFFQFALEGLENYHASLGRYEYPDQFPLSAAIFPEPKVSRVVDETNLHKVEYSIAQELLPFYMGLVQRYAEEGEDPSSYGETVYVDADLVELINERVNVGRSVAEIKGQMDPTIYELHEDEEALLGKLTDREREEALIEKVRKTAERYDLNPDMGEEVFRWMIERTKDVEVAYVKDKARQSQTPSTPNA